MRRSRWAVLLLIVVVVAVLVIQPGGSRPLEIVFLDVGQADATLIRTPDDKVALIDGGRGGVRLLELLGELDVEHLDLIVATHADFDHIGGLVRAVEEYRPTLFMDNGVPHTTQAYAELLEAVERAGSQYLDSSERTITLGDVVLEVLPPPREEEDQNDNSVGIVIRYGSFDAILPGDATAGEQAWWVERFGGRLADVEVYKAAHHGSRTGDRIDFLELVSPETVIVSAGRDNSYGHPHREALEAYSTVDSQLYRTDLAGHVTVLVTAGGETGYRIRTGDLAPAGEDGPLAVLAALISALLEP